MADADKDDEGEIIEVFGKPTPVRGDDGDDPPAGVGEPLRPSPTPDEGTSDDDDA